MKTEGLSQGAGEATCAKISLHPKRGLAYHMFALSEGSMEWTKPGFEEICLNCEISSYANAEL